MTLYQQQVLSMAIVLVKREFAEQRVTDLVLEQMDKWIEQFALQFGIVWKISHQVEFPIDNSPVILTFNALVKKQIPVPKTTDESPSEGN